MFTAHVNIWNYTSYLTITSGKVECISYLYYKWQYSFSLNQGSKTLNYRHVFDETYLKYLFVGSKPIESGNSQDQYRIDDNKHVRSNKHSHKVNWNTKHLEIMGSR